MLKRIVGLNLEFNCQKNLFHTFPSQLLAELDLLKGELDEDDDLHNIGSSSLY